MPLATDAGGISLETLSAGPVLAERATLFDDLLVLVTQHGLLHAARRIFESTGLARHRAAGNARASAGAAAGDAGGAAPSAAPAATAPAATAPAPTVPATPPATPPPTPTSPAGTPTPTPPAR